MSSEPQEPEQRPELPASGVSLGGLGADEYDRTLRPGDEVGDAGAGSSATGADPEAAPAPTAPTAEGALTLPRGGLVAFRKSGGLRFTSRGIVVYRSGRVVPLAGTAGRPRPMTAEARAALEALILRSGLSRVGHSKARGTPDGYSYEISAHYGGRTRSATVEDGAIPPDMRRLIDVLQRLMPRE